MNKNQKRKNAHAQDLVAKRAKMESSSFDPFELCSDTVLVNIMLFMTSKELGRFTYMNRRLANLALDKEQKTKMLFCDRVILKHQRGNPMPLWPFPALRLQSALIHMHAIDNVWFDQFLHLNVKNLAFHFQHGFDVHINNLLFAPSVVAERLELQIGERYNPYVTVSRRDLAPIPSVKTLVFKAYNEVYVDFLSSVLMAAVNVEHVHIEMEGNFVHGHHATIIKLAIMRHPNLENFKSLAIIINKYARLRDRPRLDFDLGDLQSCKQLQHLCFVGALRVNCLLPRKVDLLTISPGAAHLNETDTLVLDLDDNKREVNVDYHLDMKFRVLRFHVADVSQLNAWIKMMDFLFAHYKVMETLEVQVKQEEITWKFSITRALDHDQKFRATGHLPVDESGCFGPLRRSDFVSIDGVCAASVQVTTAWGAKRMLLTTLTDCLPIEPDALNGLREVWIMNWYNSMNDEHDLCTMFGDFVSNIQFRYGSEQVEFRHIPLVSSRMARARGEVAKAGAGELSLSELRKLVQSGRKK